jgi:predicted ATPase
MTSEPKLLQLVNFDDSWRHYLGVENDAVSYLKAIKLNAVNADIHSHTRKFIAVFSSAVIYLFANS